MINTKARLKKLCVVLIIALLFSTALEAFSLNAVSAATTKKVNYQDGDSHCPYCTTTDGYEGLCANASQTVGIATSSYEVTQASKKIKAAVWLGMNKSLKNAGKLTTKQRYTIHYAVSGLMGNADLPSPPATYDEVKDLETRAKSFSGTLPEELHVYMGSKSGFQDIVLWKIILNGDLKIVKESENSATLDLPSYTLKGISFTVYDESKKKVVGTLKTINKKGETSTLSLQPGTYYFKETDVGNSGYKLDSKWHKAIIKSSEVSEYHVKDEPENGIGYVKKTLKDNPKGGTVEGFKFLFENTQNKAIKYEGITDKEGEIKIEMLAGKYKVTEDIGYNDKNLQGYVDNTGQQIIEVKPGKVSKVLKWENQLIVKMPIQLKKQVTDEGTAGGFTFELEIVGKNAKEIFTTNDNGWIIQKGERDIATIGGIEIVEGATVRATEINNETDRYITPAAQEIIVTKDRSNTFSFTNVAKTSDVKLMKTSTDQQVAGIQFKLYGKTKWGKEIYASKETDNKGEIDFGPVQPGNYTIEEVGFDRLSYKSNDYLEGIENPAKSFEITGNEGIKTVSFHNIKREPRLHTLASDNKTNEHISLAERDVSITDLIQYYDLVEGEEYTLVGTLLDKENGQPLSTDGATSTVEFTPTKENGNVEMRFSIDGRGLEGKAIVICQRLYLGEKLITEANDLDDQEETIYFPRLSSMLWDQETGEKYIENLDGKILVDTIAYEGLIAGKTYVLEGTLVDQSTGIETGIKSIKEFVPDASKGIVDLEFQLNFKGFQGMKLTAFELLKQDGHIIAKEESLQSEKQTVEVGIMEEPPKTKESIILPFEIPEDDYYAMEPLIQKIKHPKTGDDMLPLIISSIALLLSLGFWVYLRKHK